jgi:Skp family chaperone for outer membrane proteins
MTPFRRTLPAFALAALALAAAGTGHAAAPAAPPAAAVATVDLSRVIDKVTERSEAEVQLNALIKKIQDEYTTRRKALEEDAKKLKDMKDAERSALRDRLALDDLRLNEWYKLKSIEIDRERALMWQSIYRNLRAECAKLADAEGYELILVNDGANEIRVQRDDKRSPEQQVQEQMANRRVLFAGKGIDVTDKLILRMNNARTAKPADAAAPAAAPAAPAAK